MPVNASGVSLDEHTDGLAVEWIEPGLPAQQAGLQVGDLILVTGEDYGAMFDTLDDQIAARSGESASLTILRNEQRMTLDLVPGAPIDIGKLLAQLVMVLAYVGLALLSARYRHQDIRARLLMIFCRTYRHRTGDAVWSYPA